MGKFSWRVCTIDVCDMSWYLHSTCTQPGGGRSSCILSISLVSSASADLTIRRARGYIRLFYIVPYDEKHKRYTRTANGQHEVRVKQHEGPIPWSLAIYWTPLERQRVVHLKLVHNPPSTDHSRPSCSKLRQVPIVKRPSEHCNFQCKSC